MNNKFELGKIYKLIEQNEFDYYRLSNLYKEAICKDITTGNELVFDIIDNVLYDVNREHISLQNQTDEKFKIDKSYNILMKKKLKDYTTTDSITIIIKRIDIILYFKDTSSDPNKLIMRVRYNKDNKSFINDDTQNKVVIENVSQNESTLLNTTTELKVYTARPTSNLSKEQLEQYITDFAIKKNQEGWSFYTISKVRFEPRHYSSKVLFGFLNKESSKGTIHVFKKSIKSIVDYLYEWFIIKKDKYTLKKTNFIKELSEYITNEKHNAIRKSFIAETSEPSEPSRANVEKVDKSESVVGGITIVTYSDKSIAVFGDTTNYKNDLKKLGGLYNPNLKWNGKKEKGWIFQIKTRKRVEELFEFEPSDELKKEVEKVRKDIIKFLESRLRTGYSITTINGKNVTKENITNLFSIWNRPNPITRKVYPEYTINKAVIFEYLYTWYIFYKDGTRILSSTLLSEFNEYNAIPIQHTQVTLQPKKYKSVEEFSDKFQKYVDTIQDIEIKTIIQTNINNLEFIKTKPDTITDVKTRQANELLRKFYKKLKELASQQNLN
jgi:hypothetical protein